MKFKIKLEKIKSEDEDPLGIIGCWFINLNCRYKWRVVSYNASTGEYYHSAFGCLTDDQSDKDKFRKTNSKYYKSLYIRNIKNNTWIKITKNHELWIQSIN